MIMESESLEWRVRRLESVEQIKALKHRYWRACDAKDVEGFRGCFIGSGATVGLGAIGSFDDAADAARTFNEKARSTVDGEFAGYDMHHGLHPDITVTSAATANGRWTLRMRHVNRVQRFEVVLAGEYDDDYVMEDGEWKISRSEFSTLWTLRRPLPADAAVGVFGIFDTPESSASPDK